MILSVLVAVAIAASTPEPANIQEDGGNQTPPANNQAQTSPAPTAVTEGSSNKGQGTKQNAGSYKNEFLAWCERNQGVITLFSTVAVAIFTGILTVYTVKAWKSSKQELRAYVGVDATSFTESPTKGVTKAELVIKNSGQTPAFDFRIKANFWYYTLPRTEFPLSEEVDRQSTATLNPGDILTAPIIFEAVVTDDTRKELIAGEAAFFLYGRMEYRDAFKARRFVNFRFIADNDPHAGGTLRWRVTEEGNDSN